MMAASSCGAYVSVSRAGTNPIASNSICVTDQKTSTNYLRSSIN